MTFGVLNRIDMESFPSDNFDAHVYRSNYPDLAVLDETELIDHYREYGVHENRSSTVISSRNDFLSLLSNKTSLLEIGVFDSPTLDFLDEMNGSRVVHYADWLSRAELIERARVIKEQGGKRDASKVPEIQWVLSSGYDQIDCIYDAVVSHHCVEHQPDLARHFIDVRSILSDGGWYLLSLPSKEYCFDYFIPETTIVDVLEAYYMKRQKPAFKSVLEHRVFTSETFFDGINPYDSYTPGMKRRFDNAFCEFNNSDYVDVHCWQFTPKSFKKIVSQLSALGIIPMINELKVYSAGGEFYAAIEFA